MGLRNATRMRRWRRLFPLFGGLLGAMLAIYVAMIVVLYRLLLCRLGRPRIGGIPDRVRAHKCGVTKPPACPGHYPTGSSNRRRRDRPRGAETTRWVLASAIGVMQQCVGLPLRQIAIIKASVTNCAVTAALIDQPTTRREKRSIRLAIS